MNEQTDDAHARTERLHADDGSIPRARRQDGASGRAGGGGAWGESGIANVAEMIRAGAAATASCGAVNDGSCGAIDSCESLWQARIDGPFE